MRLVCCPCNPLRLGTVQSYWNAIPRVAEGTFMQERNIKGGIDVESFYVYVAAIYKALEPTRSLSGSVRSVSCL